jgi:hypothetical protein
MSSDAPIGTYTTILGPDGHPQLVEVTSFLQRERYRLPAKHHAFINAMAEVWRDQFTPAQERYLQALIWKLENRATKNWWE